MNIPPFTFANSPIYIGALLVLLILFLTLRKPIKSLFRFLIKCLKSLARKTKACMQSRKGKKAKLKAKKEKIMLKKLAEEPIIKTIIKTEKIHKKFFRQDWTTGLFTIIGSGIIINALVKNWTILSSKYGILEELVYNAVGHKNLTTIIITIIFAGILILIADIFEIFQRNKSALARIFIILFFASLTAGALLLLLQTILTAQLSLINTLIMGGVFIISGFLFNFKRIFKKEKKKTAKKEEVIVQN